MTRSAPALPDLPELALFDRRATRWAVVRGLLRTAMIALGLYLAFQAAGYVVGTVAFSVHDDRFERVARTGFNVGHPDLRVPAPRGGTVSAGWLGATLRDTRLAPDGTPVAVALTVSTAGAISLERSRDTDLDRALAAGRTPADDSRAFAQGLPASALTDVVIDLRRPASADALGELLGRLVADGPVGFPVALYGDPFAGDDGVFRTALPGDALQRRPVSWPGTVTDDFASWTASLEPGDDDDLARLGLPDSATLRQLGERNLATAVYLPDVPTTVLLKMLDDPAVRGFTPVRTRLDIARPTR